MPPRIGAPSLSLPLIAALVAPGCVLHAGRQFPRPPPTPAEVSTFDSALAPYGDYFVVARLGRVWRPRLTVVGSGFVPYATGGRWVQAMSGWTFDSRWSFGQVVFHYGQWVEMPDLGWVWVPGSDWAPAWVEWQYGGGYVAWAPSPPPTMAIEWRPRWCLVEAAALEAIDSIERHLLPAHHFHLAAPVMVRIAPDRGYHVSFGPPREYVHRRPPHDRSWEPAPPPGPPGGSDPKWAPAPPGRPARTTPTPSQPGRPLENTPPATRPAPPQLPPPPPGQPAKKEHPEDEPKRRRPGEPQAGVHQMPERHLVLRRHC